MRYTLGLATTFHDPALALVGPDGAVLFAEAAERPRINQSGGDGPLELEEGFSPDIIPLLEAKGHKVR
ncbi:hypothetical protein, partial [Stenotrophomonas maltophilia]|uniref:hypothetical protein n=1 Tax=Stenotrophomonas maltophilia TaxID=40324 RepID=UPI0013DA305B